MTQPWDRPGAALEDDEPDAEPEPEPLPAAAGADTSGPEPGDEQPVAAGGHLCAGCAHAQVCGVASAIVIAGMGAGSAGDIEISKCGEFIPEAAFRKALERITTDPAVTG